jgi:hypothetical protein
LGFLRSIDAFFSWACSGGHAVCCLWTTKLVDRVVADLGTCGGDPRIDSVRIRVSRVLGWLASGMSGEDFEVRLASGAAMTDGLSTLAKVHSR